MAVASVSPMRDRTDRDRRDAHRAQRPRRPCRHAVRTANGCRRPLPAVGMADDRARPSVDRRGRVATNWRNRAARCPEQIGAVGGETDRMAILDGHGRCFGHGADGRRVKRRAGRGNCAEAQDERGAGWTTAARVAWDMARSSIQHEAGGADQPPRAGRRGRLRARAATERGRAGLRSGAADRSDPRGRRAASPS